MESRNELIKKLTAFMRENSLDMTEMIDLCADWCEEDRKRQSHPAVVSVLDSCIDGLRHASMDYYVSTK